jgi:hypothetical protein
MHRVCQRIALALALLLVLEFTSYAIFVPQRPSHDDRFDKSLPGGRWANVLGQSGHWQASYGILVIISLYAGKTAILWLCDNDALTVTLFVMMLLLCLPVFWVFVTTDWNNGHAELAYWLTLPVGLLTIPTIGMRIDLKLRPYRRIWQYVLKTAIELILIPMWLYAWVLIELVLGFYWI